MRVSSPVPDEERPHDPSEEPDSGAGGRFERYARLEALASLTSGLAHDFNNLLTVLVGNLSLLTEELRDQEPALSRARAARDSARRGSEIIRQLLEFACQPDVPSRLIYPAKIIGRIAPLIDHALGRSVRLDVDLSPRPAPVRGNAARLESVAVNLAVNARDAIGDDGRIAIRVFEAPLDEVRAGSLGVAAGEHVCLEVTDDGAGIPAALAERVFEPFFSTKDRGKGSGLGLAMVRRYAAQFDGACELDSREGEGTTVRLWFPIVAEPPDDSPSMTMPVSSLPSGNERVVVLAADESLGAVTRQVLSVLGYDCSAVRSIEELTAQIRSVRPDLIINDGFDAGDVASRFAVHGTRLLTLMAVTARENADSGVTLGKPFSIPDLAFAVRTALGTS